MPGLTIPQELQEAIQQMMEDGCTNTEISKTLGVSRPTVTRYREKYGYPPAKDINWDKYDMEKWKWLQENWPPKMPPKPKPKRRPSIKTPYNYMDFRKEDN